MTFRERARDFFGVLGATPEAARHLDQYPELTVHLVIDGERVVVSLADGSAVDASDGASVGLWDLELEADEEVFASIFDGLRTLGEALYAGLLFAPEEKSKHNLVAALGRAIRLAQRQRRRA